MTASFTMKPLLVTSGEPAGIGPDLCLVLADYQLPVVVLGDKAVFIERAAVLKQSIEFIDYYPGLDTALPEKQLAVLHQPTHVPVIPGTLDSRNAEYVVNLIVEGTKKCLEGEFSALITAPVHKGILNQGGFCFTGHTEFLAEQCGVSTVVMLFASENLKIALATTHLPLRAVPDALSKHLIMNVINTLHSGLQTYFGIHHPFLGIAGLNPHAGEGGYLGQEEIAIIQPALQELKLRGIKVQGPFPADTLFTPHYLNQFDAFVAMYHDQGLPVIKYAGFGSAVNVTLGLPFIRTSVDHGTALDLAGKGLANPESLLAALKMAVSMVHHTTSPTIESPQKPFI